MKAFAKKYGLYTIGLIFILMLFLPFLNPYYGYIIKYDYFWLHIPYHNAFFSLVDKGLPFWSWDFFLGVNFWGSKSLSVVGDVFAWLTYFLNKGISNLTISMSYTLILKFIVGYTGFYLLSKTFTKKSWIRLVVSLIYVFSGWSTTFIEQTYFTSFYMLLPYMFWGVELYLSKQHIFIYIIFTTLVILSNFYFFWPAALLLLIYWIYRYLCNHEQFIFSNFFVLSMKMLGLTLISLGLSSLVWLPGVIHLSSSTRLGNFLNTYNRWNLMNISSFFVFSFIPVLKYLDGFLKDSWYYFNQMGLYYGAISILLLPQIFYVFKNRRLKIINASTVILLYSLLLSPKIGFIFHFTYSLRYTFIILFIGIVILTQVLDQIERINIRAVLVTLVAILLSFFSLMYLAIPSIYPNGLPKTLFEMDLMWFNMFCLVGYGLILVMYKYSQNKKRFKQVSIIGLTLLILVEIFIQGQAALKSQDVLQEDYSPPYELSVDYDSAVNYIKSIDSGFYRIYQNNGYLSNINLLHDYKSISTYDSVFQYSLSDYLDWVRQYPYTNWEFRFNEPSFNRLMGVRYAIIDTSIGENFMSSDWYTEELHQFGVYRVLKYKTETSLAFTYNETDTYSSIQAYIEEDESSPLYELGDKLDQTLYINERHDLNALERYTQSNDYQRSFFEPSSYSQNWVAFDIQLPTSQMLFFSIPFDKGWSVYNNGNKLDLIYEVQGGFIGLALDPGQNHLEFKFIPQGLVLGSGLTLLSVILFCYMLFKQIKLNRNKMINCI